MGTVYPRGNKLWIGYRLANGEYEYKPTGLALDQEARARSVLRKIETRIASGAALGELQIGSTTVNGFLDHWLEKREKSKASAAKLARHYLAHARKSLGDKKLAEVRRADVRDMVLALEHDGQKIRGTGRLAPRTVRHVYFTLREAFIDAVDAGLVDVNPCSLRRGQLPLIADKDPTWRRGARYEHDELVVLIADPSIAAVDRVAHAIEGLAGLRPGEASALRWRCWDPTIRPLGRLDVVDAYDSLNRREKSTKTRRAREVPVHLVLARILAEWKLGGWAAYVGRAPKPDDLIIPVVDGGELRMRHKDEGLAAVRAVIEANSWRQRRQYDLRRTFVSMARNGGCRPDVLSWVKDGRPRKQLDDYTEMDWPTLCEVVGCIKFELPKVDDLALAAGAGAPPDDDDPSHSRRTTVTTMLPESSVERASTRGALNMQPREISLRLVSGSRRQAPTDVVVGALDSVRILVPQPPTPPPLLGNSEHCSKTVVDASPAHSGRRPYRAPSIVFDVDVFELAAGRA